jgi:methyl-accepting chemotaxis protein
VQIATASREQAKGVNQITTGIAQIDKVTQSTAASAEESASASEELSAQANALNRGVDELLEFIDGGKAKSSPVGSEIASVEVKRVQRRQPPSKGLARELVTA